MEVLLMNNSLPQFPQGSVWRKWDLHVHTPESYFNNFSNNWDDYVKSLISAVKKHNISVIATADYFTIDGYRKLLSYYDQKTQLLKYEENSVKVFIIPGIELRLDIFNNKDESINLHVLFDPDLCDPDFIKIHFLNELKIHYQDTEYSLNDNVLTAIGHSIINGTQVDLTQKFNEGEKNGFIKKALEVITLNQKSIKDACNYISKNLGKGNISNRKHLIATAGKGHGSLTALNWFDSMGNLSRSGLTRESLTKYTDIVFSNDSKDIEFYLGTRADAPEEEIKKRFGRLKPCVWGSDAHSTETLLHPSNGQSNKYTWIKANPTFEGLKQIIFEPTERVKIQVNEPDTKTPYNVIEKARFISNSGELAFPTNFIHFNQNLNAVIGGKSSGKSLLLYFMAKTVVPQQVNQKRELVKIGGYNFPTIDFEVHWKDGKIDKLSGPLEEKNRIITYIPQLYINQLSEEEGQNQLKEFIENILRKNEALRDSFDTHEAILPDYISALTNSLGNIISLKAEALKSKREIIEIGEKEAIEKNIEDISKKIEDLKATASFTEEQERNYQKLIADKEKVQSKKEQIEDYNEKIIGYTQFLKSQHDEVLASFELQRTSLKKEYENDSLAINFIDKNFLEDYGRIKELFQDTQNKYSLPILRFNETNKKLSEKLEVIDNDLAPLLEKFSNQELLQKYTKQLVQEREKIKKIEAIESEIKRVLLEIKENKKNVTENYRSVLKSYSTLVNEINRSSVSEFQKLQLRASLSFDSHGFSDSLGSILDGRASFRSKFGEMFDDSNIYLFEHASHIENLLNIFETLDNSQQNEIRYKSGFTSTDAINNLFKDFFNLEYEIELGEDNIKSMSPGKRGLVLLQLILHLSDSSYPILIDQPEDNLDNRTIYKDLINFIKEKKIERQIIIVTHNPNLVVATDSEQVLVANHSGQEQGRDNKQFKFEYITGAIEDTHFTPENVGVLYQKGIREHICEILEGGEDAFKIREDKYGFKI